MSIKEYIAFDGAQSSGKSIELYEAGRGNRVYKNQVLRAEVAQVFQQV